MRGIPFPILNTSSKLKWERVSCHDLVRQTLDERGIRKLTKTVHVPLMTGTHNNSVYDLGLRYSTDLDLSRLLGRLEDRLSGVRSRRPRSNDDRLLRLSR